MTHSVAPLAANLRYRRGKCQQPRMGLEEEDYSGRLCPLSEQRCGGRKWWGSSGVGGRREEVSCSCPAGGPKIWSAFLVSASPAIRSRPSLFYLVQRTHSVSQAHARLFWHNAVCGCLDLLWSAASIRPSNAAKSNRTEGKTHSSFVGAKSKKLSPGCSTAWFISIHGF